MKKQRGFTSIELLVVIAIIAVLAVMLLPATAKAKKESRRAIGLANQHQIMLGIKMYAQDWHGLYPVSWTGGFWQNWAGAPLYHPSTAAGALGVLYPNYVSNAKVFIDPDDPQHYSPVLPGEWSATFKGNTFSTGNPLNDPTGYSKGAGESYAYALDCGEMTNVNTCILVDKSGGPTPTEAGNKTYYWNVGPSLPFYIENPNAATTVDSYIVLLHGTAGVNATYVDGHDQWVPTKDIPTMIPNWITPAERSATIVNP